MVDSVNNLGTVSYIPSALPEQGTADYNSIPADYNSMPVMYEPEYEEKKKAASNMKGLTIMGIIAAAGITYGVVKHRGLKQAKSDIETLNKEIKTLTDEKTKLTKELDSLRKPSKKTGFWSWFKRNKKAENTAKPEAKPEAKAEVKAEAKTEANETTKSE